MPTGVAVVCDTDNCLAVYLAVKTGDTDDERSAGEVTAMARKAAEGDGWVAGFGIGQAVMTCPGCADGRGPALERGTCRWRMGLVGYGVQVRVRPAPDQATPRTGRA